MGNLCVSRAKDNQFLARLDTCKAEGSRYVDKEFPADRNSLIGNWDEDHEDVKEIVDSWAKYEWLRASDIPCLNDSDGKLSVFAGKIEPADIKQGGLGDCYFLSVLSVLTEKPDRIKRLFMSEEVNDQGIFGVQITKNGLLTQVILDDYIPCD